MPKEPTPLAPLIPLDALKKVVGALIAVPKPSLAESQTQHHDPKPVKSTQ